MLFRSGVSSDVVLPPVYSVEDVGEKTLDYSLPPQSIGAFVSSEGNSSRPELHWEPLEAKALAVLVARSKERVAKNAKFTEIRRELDEAAKNKGTVKLSDLRKQTAKENEKEQKEQKELAQKGSRKDRERKAREIEAPLVDESVNILADWIELQPSRADGQPIQAAQIRSE